MLLFHQDVSPRDVLGVRDYCSLSFPVLNSPGVSEVMCMGIGYYFSLSFPVLNCLDVSPRDVLGVRDYCSLSFQYWTVQMYQKWCAGCRLLFQSLISSTEQSRCIRSDVLGVGYYFILLVPVLNCKDASAIDVLGVCYYFILSLPVLNSLADHWYGL